MVNESYKVLCVCPTNRLLQGFESDAIKISKLMWFGGDKIEQFEYSELYVAVFDEIYFSALSICIGTSNSLLSNIYIVKLFATGHTKQLKLFQELSDTQDYENYADAILENILLNVYKKLKREEDKQRLNNLNVKNNNIFVDEVPTPKLIEKCFRYTDDITLSTWNIAYSLNKSCKHVSSEVKNTGKQTI